MFRSLQTLLKAKCANCHRLRVDPSRARTYLVLMKLLEMGDMESFERIRSTVLDASAELKDFKLAPAVDREEELEQCEQRYAVFLDSGMASRAVNMHTGRAIDKLAAAFHSEALKSKRCATCKANSPAVRKDGFSKLFEIPLSNSRALQNENSNIKLMVRNK